MNTTTIGFDYETGRIAGQNVVPEAICLSVAAEGVSELRACVEPEYQEIVSMLVHGTDGIVAHNAAFDCAVICFNHPDLMSAVWEMVADHGRVHCTKIREKLLNLTTHGSIDFGPPAPDGTVAKQSYHLSDLVFHYFGEDISDNKAADSWRLNYNELKTLPASEYPPEAAEYAVSDAVHAERIFHLQEERRQVQIKETGIDPFATEHFRVAVDFALLLMTAWGIATDPEKFHEVKAMLTEALKPENTVLLVEAGILRPAIDPRPHKNGAVDENGEPKMTKGQKESVDTKAMRAHMLELKKAMPDEITLRRTVPSDRFPKGQLSYDAEWQDDHYHLCPIISQFRDRSKLQKLVTTELPRMMMLDDDGERTEQLAPVVHPCFDVLKRTGRVSSFAGNLHPSFNCQNVDPRVRGCYVPRPGFVFLSSDYAQMELGTLAQTTLKLFGKSVMADKINAGIDLHAFLGGSIAYNTDEQFRNICDKQGVTSPDDIYEVFVGLKGSDEENVRKFFKHYRTLAKPTGLGYPGGLMPKTFVAYAKGTYGVEIDIKTATLLRDVWLAVFPEMNEYFDFINKDCEDERNSPRLVKWRNEDGEEKTRQQSVYAYSTPYGLYRAGCDYCAAANGMGLQSPSADGALTGLLNVVRACYDPAMQSILYDDGDGPACRPVAFIHDELICELREDEIMHERAEAVSEIMVAAMKQVTPDVVARVENALMRRWNKAAESVFDDEGTLQVWTPEENQ